MSSFKTPLVIEFDFEGNPRRPYKLDEPFSYYTDLLPVPIIDVPRGYRTDVASIPRLFWRILPPAGRYGKAAVVHDWLCDVSPKICNHIGAANVFGEAMQVLGVGLIKQSLMVFAVKTFGPRFNAGDAK
jgi:hypothetical protein